MSMSSLISSTNHEALSNQMKGEMICYMRTKQKSNCLQTKTWYNTEPSNDNSFPFFSKNNLSKSVRLSNKAKFILILTIIIINIRKIIQHLRPTKNHRQKDHQNVTATLRFQDFMIFKTILIRIFFTKLETSALFHFKKEAFSLKVCWKL